MRLIGYDLLLQGKETQVRFYWQPLKLISEPQRLFPLFFNQTQTRVLEDTTVRPLMENVWYPPQQWQVGETVQSTTLPFAVGNDYDLMMAVLENGIALNGPRLPVSVGVGSAIPEITKENAPTLLRVRDNRVDSTSLRQFALPDSAEARAEQVGETIRLAGTELQGEAKAGYTLSVSLYWQAETPPPEDYTAFVQILHEGRVVVQSDHFPVTHFVDRDVERPTSSWASGEIVEDRHVLSLPPDLAPGSYEVVGGMYLLTDNARRLSVTSDGVRLQDDLIPIGSVIVSAP
jgi:hypothetical protein